MTAPHGPTTHLIVACSLDPASRSARLADALAAELTRRGEPVVQVSLGDLDLPFCDAGACYSDPNVQRIRDAIETAATVTLAVPIYNYDVGGAARNLIALTGRAWSDKVVGFVCAAGGSGSFMSVMGLANSLMLDFRSVIVPRFVYATRNDFDDDAIPSDVITERLAGLASDLTRMGTALNDAPPLTT